VKDYRSYIDKIVGESGYSGSLIAREMGITVNRIIALRRALSENISTDDVASCKSAISRLKIKKPKDTQELPTKELTLYEICGEDMEICAKKKDGQIEIKVTDEKDREVFFEKTHQVAWDSLVYFAKQVIFQDERIQYSEANNND